MRRTEDEAMQLVAWKNDEVKLETLGRASLNRTTAGGILPCSDWIPIQFRAKAWFGGWFSDERYQVFF